MNQEGKTEPLCKRGKKKKKKALAMGVEFKRGWYLGRGGVQGGVGPGVVMMFEHGAGLGRGQGRAGARPCSSAGWGLCLGPVQNGRGSTWKRKPLECGFPEFGGRTLSEAVWVQFRPSALEGVSECRGGVLGGG